MVELIVSSQAIDQQPSEIIAVGFFEDERPLRSEAGFIDSCLGGMISSCLKQGFMTGHLGETTLVPTNRRVRADKILFVGLGEVMAFCPGSVRVLAEHVIKVSLGLQVYDIAMTFPDPLAFGLGWAKLIEAMIEGVGAGLEAKGLPHAIRLRLLGGSDHYDQIQRGVQAGRKVLKNPFVVKVCRDPSSLTSTDPDR
jgi:hypothetical protein